MTSCVAKPLISSVVEVLIALACLRVRQTCCCPAVNALSGPRGMSNCQDMEDMVIVDVYGDENWELR
jgi:hypothetical protein